MIVLLYYPVPLQLKNMLILGEYEISPVVELIIKNVGT